MRELPTPRLVPAPVRPPDVLLPTLCAAEVGCTDDAWISPSWLMPHQQRAAQRLAGALRVFGGALLADAVGLGKTYVALALSTRYRSTVVVAPASLLAQWRRTAQSLAVEVTLLSHTALSRGRRLPRTAFVVVDEAHHFRNPKTKRYDRLARDRGAADVLLTTATPVVNRAADLVHLVRLFLPDNGVAPLGVRSLARAVSDRRYEGVMHALSPMIVARSAESARLNHLLPAASGSRTIRAATMCSHDLRQSAAAIDALRFPSFGAEASELLRLQLLHRLASSRDAYLQSLLRHSAYLRRAQAAARRGERLSRAAARALFGADELPQLELALSAPCSGPEIAAARFAEEAGRVSEAISYARRSTAAPKAGALRNVLLARGTHKTIVFTTATVTAESLASALAWHGVVLVTAHRARIASGGIGIEEALALFAPRARKRALPPESQAAHVLIATDLVSEGLDLQDADAVVHYDLPWTPLRLEQRLGRIARLGTTHRSVDVWWFAPPRVLERRLALARRIHDKARTQLRLAVASSSAVGRARLLSGMLDLRERVVDCAGEASVGHSVVSEMAGGLCALRWDTHRGPVRQLTTLTGRPGIRNVGALEQCRGVAAPVPQRHLRALRGLIGRRASATDTGALDPAARRLKRMILARARTAAHRREAHVIARLDAALDRVHSGLPVGAERELADALAAGQSGPRLDAWLDHLGERRAAWIGPTVDALVVSE